MILIPNQTATSTSAMAPSHHTPSLLLHLLLVISSITTTSPHPLHWGSTSESMAFLNAHNVVRAAHREPPMIWDSHLEARARWWASQRRHDCSLQHSFPEGGFVLGENIFWGGGSGWTPEDAVHDWAVEEQWYSYSKNSCRSGEECGHYTQIVWRDTWRVGCARQICDDGDVFMVCNYDPPGNVVGQRPY